MIKRNIITDLALWISLVFVFCATQWKINEVFRTREIMIKKNEARIQKLQEHVDMLDMAILSGEHP